MDKNDYKIERVEKWTCPEETGVPLITMPNVPRPLHRLNPRNIMGQSTWNHVRKRCYYNAHYKCEICGVDFAEIKPRYAAHELYSYDYMAGTGKFERCIAICAQCHNAIHSGRLITMYKNGNQLYPKQYVLKVVEHCFRLVSQYNAEHRNKKPLKLYATFLEYLKVPELHDDMVKLIDKYNIQFYMEPKRIAKWQDWKLIIGNKEHKTPYKDEGEWIAAMEEANKNNAGLENSYAARVMTFDGIDSVSLDDEKLAKINEADIPEDF